MTDAHTFDDCIASGNTGYVVAVERCHGYLVKVYRYTDDFGAAALVAAELVLTIQDAADYGYQVLEGSQ